MAGFYGVNKEKRKGMYEDSTTQLKLRYSKVFRQSPLDGSYYSARTEQVLLFLFPREPHTK